ncbi:MAG: peptidylprolyl isomerase [Euzebya sp.]
MSRLLVLLCVLALAASACAQGLAGPGVAAVINGEQITVAELRSQVQAYLQARNPQTGQAPDEAQATNQALFQTTLAILLSQQILQRGGEPVTTADVDAAIDQIIADSGGPEAFQTRLESQGLTLETFRLDQRVGLRVDRLQRLLAADIEVTDEDVQFAYESQFGQPSVSHILVPTEQEAADVVDRLDAGEDFATVAQDVSSDPGSAPGGGDLGPLQIGAFVPEFEDAALALEPGEISDPVQTQFGWHVITVAAPAELTADLRQQITEQIQLQQVAPELNRAFEAALDEAQVEVNPRFGRWDPGFREDGGLDLIVSADPLGELVGVTPAGAQGLGGLPAPVPTPAPGG